LHFSSCSGAFWKKLGALPVFVVHFSIKPGATPEIVVHFWKTVVHLQFSWRKRECVVHYSI
jgi:hypothetical protein